MPRCLVARLAASNEGDTDGVDHQAEIVHLGEDGNTALLDGNQHFGVAGGAGEEHNALGEVGSVGQQCVVEREPVHLRHENIADHGVYGFVRLNDAQRFGRRAGLGHGESGPLQVAPKRAADRLFVVNDKHIGHTTIQPLAEKPVK